MNTPMHNLHGRFVASRRARMLAQDVASLLPARSKVLDVGCGDGTIDSLIMEHREDVAINGVDVLMRPASKIPVQRFNGTQLPCADKSFDVVTFVDVLHHTNDPIILLREAKRVARNLVVLKDHTMNGLLASQTLRFMDWVGNAHHGVALPYNYWPEQRWKEVFAELELRLVRWEPRLHLYPQPWSLIFERGLHFLTSLSVVR